MDAQALIVKAVLDHWDTPVGMLMTGMMVFWFMTQKMGFQRQASGRKSTTDSTRIVEILERQTKILEDLTLGLRKLETDVDRHFDLTRGMKEEDARARESLARCFDRINDSVTQLASYVREIHGFERGRAS